MDNREIIRLIKGFNLAERLKIAEDILRNIREEILKSEVTNSSGKESEPAILKFAGIMEEEEAKVWESAVAESRKI